MEADDLVGDIAGELSPESCELWPEGSVKEFVVVVLSSFDVEIIQRRVMISWEHEGGTSLNDLRPPIRIEVASSDLTPKEIGP